MVMEVVHEDTGEGNMQCTDHPYRNSSPGGICAFCLQEKLGKLISSSFYVPIFPSTSSSSSSSRSFRSDFGGKTTATATAADALSDDTRRSNSKLPFVLTHRKKTKNDGGVLMGRSKSTTAPRRGMHFSDENYADDYNPHRRGFWSFIYLSKHSTNKKNENIKHYKDLNFASATPSSTVGSSSMKMKSDENGSPYKASYDRKVSRSRSVGCGNRSFSGDLFERISTGFGDCTLRRVESEREGKPTKGTKNGGNGFNNGQESIKGRVRCGGIFSGFMINSSSSSSSSSSYWDNNNNMNGKRTSTVHSSMGHVSNGRSNSWGWALVSPMRAFSKPSSAKREANSRKELG